MNHIQEALRVLREMRNGEINESPSNANVGPKNKKSDKLSKAANEASIEAHDGRGGHGYIIAKHWRAKESHNEAAMAYPANHPMREIHETHAKAHDAIYNTLRKHHDWLDPSRQRS